MQLDRKPLFIRGAHFYRDGDEDMWAFGIDPNNSLGPRRATAKDKKDYPAEWEAYQRELFNGADPKAFDHDGDGSAGGTVPHVGTSFIADSDYTGASFHAGDDNTRTFAKPKRRGRPPKKAAD